MNLRNCKRCGRLHSEPGPICHSCLKKEEEKFEEVRAYLKENPNSPMVVVAQETGVTINELERFLREGRIEASAGMKDAIKCLKCGKPIDKGRYCDECERKRKEKVSGEIRKTVSESRQKIKPEHNPNDGGPKMHYVKNIKKN